MLSGEQPWEVSGLAIKYFLDLSGHPCLQVMATSLQPLHTLQSVVGNEFPEIFCRQNNLH